MTLVLSVVNPAYSLQVADRLLTANLMPVDRVSNKNILFLGSDGILAIGYTGPAFLHGVPTDVRIAGALTGGKALAGLGTHLGPAIQTRDVGFSMRAVAEELTRHRNFARGHGEVVAVGWQWGRKRRQLWRSVYWELSGDGEGRIGLKQRLPRPPAKLSGDLYLGSLGDDPMTEAEHRELLNAVIAAGLDHDSAEGLLVSAIRRASGQKATIGPNCMSILITRPKPRVRFIPQQAHLALANGSPIEVGFSPWIIAPGAIMPPSELVGSFQLGAGPLVVDVEGPEPSGEQSVLGAFKQQLRPNVPGYRPHPHGIRRP